jgi:hypothetical protein
MAQLGEQLALAAGQVLRSGRVVMRMTPKRASQEQASWADELTSGFPNAPLSPGQADFGAGEQQPSASPARVFLRRMHAALARVGGGGRTPAESVGPASLNFQDGTPVRPRRPEQTRPSDVDLQADASEQKADASEQILKDLQRVIASQEKMHAEVTAVKAEVQQVRAAVTAELQPVRAEVQVWRAEMEKTVRTVELKEAQLRTQILGTTEGLVHIEQKLQEEVAQMCAKLEMMQNEQEKKKGNEEERLNVLVRERVEEFEHQREEKEIARLQEHQQSLEEWLKHSQREFNKKMAEKVDKFKQESETKVTIVLEMCEQVAEQLRKYESLLKFDDQRPQLEQEWPEQGQPTQKQREAPAELRYEAEKLADNDQAEAQEEPTLDAAEMAADAQEVPTLDRTQSKENEVAADTHNVRSRLSTLPYGDQEEHETTAKYLPSSFRAPTVAAGTSTGAASGGSSGFSLGATKSAAPVQPASAAVKNSADGMSAANGQEASSELPSLADMFKPKPGEWDCQTCKTRNKPTATIRCMACWEKPGAPAQAVLVLRDMAGVVQDILVRVGASTSVSQVRTEASHELKCRGVHSEIVSKLIVPNGKELDSVGPYYLMHRAEAQTLLSFEIGELIAAEGLDEKESDSDIVIRLQESTLDAEREKDILMRVSASSTGLQVRAGVLSELKRRGARKKLQRLFYLGKDLKDDDVVGAVQLTAPSPWGYAHTVVYMCLAKDTGEEAVILAGIKAAWKEQEKQLQAPALVA